MGERPAWFDPRTNASLQGTFESSVPVPTPLGACAKRDDPEPAAEGGRRASVDKGAQRPYGLNYEYFASGEVNRWRRARARELPYGLTAIPAQSRTFRRMSFPSRRLLRAYLLGISVTASAAFAQCDDGGPAPDDDLGHGHAVANADQMEHSRSDLINYISANIDAGLASDMNDATDPDDGCAEVVEAFNSPGASDATTIAVRTRGTPIWYSSMVFIHEYRHWQNSRPASIPTGDPDTTDPTTDPEVDPCGDCNHAMMAVDDMHNLTELVCLGLSTSEKNTLCNFSWHARKQAAKKLTACAYNGCTACCGKTYIPSINEVWHVPECCQ